MIVVCGGWGGFFSFCAVLFRFAFCLFVLPWCNFGGVRVCTVCVWGPFVVRFVLLW